jgi:hypothetical protein
VSYRYIGKITSVDAKANTISFAIAGTAKKRCELVARLRDDPLRLSIPLDPGAQVWISGKLTDLEEADMGAPVAARLILSDCLIYPPSILNPTK